jgi:betaine-aldehyde dehydrogenase
VLSRLRRVLVEWGNRRRAREVAAFPVPQSGWFWETEVLSPVAVRLWERRWNVLPMYIGGEFVAAADGATTEVVNPADGGAMATVPQAGIVDLDRAVAAAARAFPEWARTTPGERAGLLNRLGGIVAGRARQFAEAETAHVGKPIRLSSGYDVAGSIDNIYFFAGAARNLEGKAAAEYSPDHTSMIRREPLGVVGSVVPWNYPLQMAVWKLLPAVAAGNTIVLKPALISPLSALLLAEACHEAGFPRGVVNVVTGPGGTVGQALIEHPAVAMVSLTGSTETGSLVMRAAAGTIKRVHLELGGKAPFVVMDDANLGAAVQGAVAGALVNSGQDCTAATRAYVHRSLYRDFVLGVVDTMKEVRLGDPMDPATDQGPLASRRQQEIVAGFVQRAAASGAQVLCGGKPGGGDLARGAFYEPTVVTGAAQDSEIVQREVFGPVLVVLPFDDVDEAYRLANDVEFGLAASIWTRDVSRALEGARRLQAGTVWVNDHLPVVSEMPHGGCKRSGAGKDQAQYSLDEYTLVKHVMVDLTGDVRKGWHRLVWGGRGA